MLISENYREQNRKLHESQTYGISGAKYFRIVAVICDAAKTRNVLDYGCGKQALKSALKDYNVTSYDPCIAGLDQTPEPHDIVYCGDVLEHVEPDCIDFVLTDIRRCMSKVAILVTNSDPANKRLPDGRNAHLIQKPMWWWAEKIGEKFRIMTYERRNGDHVFIVQHKEIKMKRWDWLLDLSLSNGWKRGIELGVKEGHMSINLAKNGIDMIAVDMWKAVEQRKIVGAETYQDTDMEAIYQNFKGNAERLNIFVIREDTKTAHQHVADKSVDFCFIDADHSYESVKEDIRLWLPKVKHFISGHDYQWPTVHKAVTEAFDRSKIIEGPDHCWGVFI